jgi:hypothetical protein
MSFQVLRIQFCQLPARTRFPFRYGIVSLTHLRQLFVRAEVLIDGKLTTGTSADGLPPKWFTKNPDTRFEEEDLPEMLRVIRHAADCATGIPPSPTLFAWWRQLSECQSSWASEVGLPSLLAGFGISLIERAVIDAICRARNVTYFDALRQNTFGIELHAIRSELQGMQPSDVLDSTPRTTVSVRHTIGLADPLDDADISVDDNVSDGLPQSLTDNIRSYGLRYFKIKLSGQLDQDRDRLRSIAEILGRHVKDDARFTLDGNENYSCMDEFRKHWMTLCQDPLLQSFFAHGLLFVEQPVHRRTALNQEVRDDLLHWPDAPAIIIDESDGDVDCFPRALDLGYSGTSHKNCKGVIKGFLQLATVRQRKANGHPCILSAEDLCNIGPIALLQDLAVVAAFGMKHVERNGHHYFAGLSMLPAAEQQRTLNNHSDLYRTMSNGVPTLAIRQGRIALNSVNAAPFGVHESPDPDAFDEWSF